jgi:hypothetical protein
MRPMPQAGRPELEQVAETPAPLAPETAPVALEPATAAPVAVPYGARSPEGLGGMRDVMALSSPGERRRFVLQLQRTAGNAAVCRWLGIVRDRYASGAGGGSPDEPPDADDPRER